MYDIIELNAKKVLELKEIAKKLGVARVEKQKKQDLVYSILDEQALRPGEASKKSPKPKSKPAAERSSTAKKEETSEEKPKAPRGSRPSKKDDSASTDADEKTVIKGKRQPGDAIRERRAKQSAKNNDSSDPQSDSSGAQTKTEDGKTSQGAESKKLREQRTFGKESRLQRTK